MNELLDLIFGVGGPDQLGFGDEGVRLSAARPIPAWGWAIVVALAVAASVWSYSKLEGSRIARSALAGLRAALLVLLAVLVSGPRLERSSSTTEADWLVVLADRSASMTVPDATGAPTAAGQRTRDDELRERLAQAAPALEEIAADKRIAWFGFDAGAYEIGEGPRVPDLRSPDGRRTALGSSLAQALERLAGRPVAGVVVLSDGRSSDDPARVAARRLEAERIPLFAVALGSEQPRADWLVRAVTAPSVAFADDVLPVTVDIERRAGDTIAQESALVELVDAATGVVLDAARVESAGDEPVTLSARPSEDGPLALTVRVTPDRPDLVASNNERGALVEIVSGPLRVLYLDGYPRWEQRYLKALLNREESIQSSNLLLSATRRYQQEGDIALGRLPVTAEQWGEFDVVVLGDLRGELLSPEQLEGLRDHVATGAGGLLWLGGPGATPTSWLETPLADLLPMTVTGGAIEPWPEPVTLTRGAGAERLGLIELGASGEGAEWAERVADPRTGWSTFRWAQRIDPRQLKPAAEIFAQATPVSAAAMSESERASVATPLVVSMRYGAGRTVYVATDEIWRWRYGHGEDLGERFWLPIVRLLARERISRAGARAVLTAAPEQPVVGAPVTIGLEIYDQTLLEAAPASASVRIRLPRGDEQTIRLERAPGENRFAAAWTPREPGEHEAEVSGALFAGLGLTAAFEAVSPDDELRTPQSDHETLRVLAEQTGGQVLTPARLGLLPGLLPNRSREIPGPTETVALWDRVPSLVLLLVLGALEWAGRRLIRLS